VSGANDAEKHPVWSGNLGDRPPITTSANDLAALITFLGISSAVLARMSQGGFLAVRCNLVHPERVRALILIAAQTGTDDPHNAARLQQDA
jgi:pimeloyl-ACP methyl ester carboxylesterase